MSPNEARKHLSSVLQTMEHEEMLMQKKYGDALPRTTRARDKKTIKALQVLLNKDSK